MPRPKPSNQVHYTNQELTKLNEDQLLEMLFEGHFQEHIASRQAAHELRRREESLRTRLNIWFAALASISAVGSAVAAFAALSQNCK